MKKIIRTVAFITVIGIATSACQKEPMVNLQSTTIYESGTINASYTVDGITYHASFTDNDEWQAFLDLLFTWAEEGRNVSFYNADPHSSIVKQDRKIVTYTTDNKEEAKRWAGAMEKEGYVVHIDYDATTGIYTCTAVK
ncbi:MAG: hypothetical protein IJ524_06390 [Bacteroidales bacterium]|nr:hypothetical protein [Bacteroidales bacterium]